MSQDTTSQLGNSIDLGNADEFLQSASNAVQHGQRQFLTPRTLAAALALLLPPVRKHAIDLNMGRGDLLATTGAEFLLGMDIHKAVARKPNNAAGEWRTLWGDVTHWYSLARQIEFIGDLFTLNPPFGLNWYTDRLKKLADSRCPAVSDYWQEHVGRKETIDSTIATLLIALDRCSNNGEGYMICNEETAVRLLGHPTEAATSTVRDHVWLWLTIPHQIWENQGRQFNTCVLFFSRTHPDYSGRRPPFHIVAQSPNMEDLHDQLAPFATSSALCSGNRVTRGFHSAGSTMEDWNAITEEYKACHHPDGTRRWNIYMNDNGTVGCYLSTFDNASGAANRVQLANLHAIRDQHPAHMVVQKNERLALIHATTGGVFRVHPDVTVAVENAVAEYEAMRAPFYQPNPIQSLGHLDELDRITCRHAMQGFIPGETYPLSTRTETLEDDDEIMNLAGEPEAVTRYGKELLIELRDENGDYHWFHIRRAKNVPEEIQTHHNSKLYHWLVSDLVKHFEIPVVKDLSITRPDEYATALATLDAIEATINRTATAV